jgi:hypothetical protein
MRVRGAARILLVVLAAVVFGAAMSVMKGNGAGVRDGIGNLSAPWVIAPMLGGAAAARGRIFAGAVIGLLTTVAALAGFYLANAFVLDLGPHSTFHDLGLTLDVGNLWFKAGAVSGPVMGAAGAWASRRGRFTVAAIVIATVVLEPLAVYLVYFGSGGFFGAGDGQWNGIYAGECIVGLVAAVVLWRARGGRRRSSATS